MGWVAQERVGILGEMTQSEKLSQDRQLQEGTLWARWWGRWLTWLMPLSAPGSQEKYPKPIVQMRTLRLGEYVKPGNNLSN